MDTWTIEAVDHRVVARIEGEIDLRNGRDLVDFLARLGDVADCPVEVDLSGVDFIDSSGLKALLDVRWRLLERGSSLTLVNPSDSAQRLLDLTGCTQIFTVIHRETEVPTVTD